MSHFRPVVTGVVNGRIRFDCAVRLERGRAPQMVASGDIPGPIRARLTAPRAAVAGFDWSRPLLMGVLNVTPDSFSDGGQFAGHQAIGRALELFSQGADIVDIGGESTRPGAEPVPAAEELARIMPVVHAMKGRVLSVDTRNAAVARAALAAGVWLFNDVSALTHDPASMAVAAESGAPVCLMHAAGDPRTMQDDPRYDDVLLDVYDYLEARIAACAAAGIARERIIVDPGIGFGKTLAHNLALLRGISLFHGLGCPILVGVSRKRFIGAIAGEPDPQRRAPGSIAAGLHALSQGVQMLRVHDMVETRQAVAIWREMMPDQ